MRKTRKPQLPRLPKGMAKPDMDTLEGASTISTASPVAKMPVQVDPSSKSLFKGKKPSFGRILSHFRRK